MKKRGFLSYLKWISKLFWRSIGPTAKSESKNKTMTKNALFVVVRLIIQCSRCFWQPILSSATDHLFLFSRQKNDLNFEIFKLTNDTTGTLTWNLLNTQWPKTQTQFYDNSLETYFGYNHTSFPPTIASEDQNSVFIWSKEVSATFHSVCYDGFNDCERIFRFESQKTLEFTINFIEWILWDRKSNNINFLGDLRKLYIWKMVFRWWPNRKKRILYKYNSRYLWFGKSVCNILIKIWIL